MRVRRQQRPYTTGRYHRKVLAGSGGAFVPPVLAWQIVNNDLNNPNVNVYLSTDVAGQWTEIPHATDPDLHTKTYQFSDGSFADRYIIYSADEIGADGQPLQGAVGDVVDETFVFDRTIWGGGRAFALSNTGENLVDFVGGDFGGDFNDDFGG